MIITTVKGSKVELVVENNQVVAKVAGKALGQCKEIATKEFGYALDAGGITITMQKNEVAIVRELFRTARPVNEEFNEKLNAEMAADDRNTARYNRVAHASYGSN